MKKYHHSPTFGVKSGRSNWTPYVDSTNSQDPVIIDEIWRSECMNPARPKRFRKTKPYTESFCRFDPFRSKHKSANGGKSNIGYIERYEAMDNANMDVKEDPVTAFEMACRIAQVVKTLVGRPIQVAIVKGLNRKLNQNQNATRIYV
jgi:hypothetical protein